MKIEKRFFNPKGWKRGSSTLKVGKRYQANWALKDAKQLGFWKNRQTSWL